MAEKMEGDDDPLYSNDMGYVDTSDARLVVIDGHQLKADNYRLYRCLLVFLVDCTRNCYLQLFTHPGDSGDDEGGVTSFEGEQLEDGFFNYQATTAIDQYNTLITNGKLALKQVLKVNFCYWGAARLYITLSAINQDTAQVATYQAALLELEAQDGTINGYVLGLFRHCTTEKILAILSIKGGEEDMAAQYKMVEDSIRKGESSDDSDKSTRSK